MKNIETVDFLGLPLTIWSTSGVVRDESTRSQSELNSSRNLHGNIANVHLSTTNIQDIWLALDDGSEMRLRVGGLAVPVRPGHRLQAFYALPPGAKSGNLVAVKNLNTREKYDTINSYQPLPNPGFFKLPLLSKINSLVFAFGSMILVFVGGGILAHFNVTSFDAGAWITGIGMLAGVILQNSGALRAFRQFKQNLNKVIDGTPATF